MSAELIVARLERMPFSSWHVRARLVVGAATLFDAVDALAIAYVLPVLVSAWRLSPQQVGILISVGYAGQLAGAIFFGWLAERAGRLKTLVYTVAIFSVMSLLCAVSWDYSSLLTFRTIQGVGLGGEVPVAAAYMNELLRAKGRGRFFLMYEQVYSAGRVVAALLGVWIVPRFGWRYMFLLGGAAALLVLILRRSLLESPRWLASQGRLNEAERVVAEIESHISQAGTLLAPAAPSGLRAEKSATDWRELFRGIYRFRTLTIWVIWFAAFLILNGLGTWVPTLYRTVFRLSVQSALSYGLFSSLGGFAGCIVVALLIEWTGRRLWFTLAFLLGGLACVALWCLGASSATVVLIFTSAAAFFVNSVAVVVFLYTPEIYPTRIRALATSVASAWLRVASIVGPILIGFTIGRYPLAIVFLEFGVVALIGALVAGLFTLETKDRILEEISP